MKALFVQKNICSKKARENCVREFLIHAKMRCDANQDAKSANTRLRDAPISDASRKHVRRGKISFSHKIGNCVVTVANCVKTIPSIHLINVTLSINKQKNLRNPLITKSLCKSVITSVVPSKLIPNFRISISMKCKVRLI